MPIINSIPDRYEEGFKELATISQKQFDSINEGLSLTSLTNSIWALANKVSQISSLDIGIIKPIFLSIGSLIPLINEENRDEIVDDICKLYLENNEEVKIDVLKYRLNSFLANTQIYYASKASELMSEYGSIYLSARLVSDIRPVFGVNVEEDPKGAMVIHNLHIHYQSDREGDHKDIYLALDASDIKNLKEILERAEAKEKALNNILRRGGVTNLNE